MFNIPLHFFPVIGEKVNDFIPLFSLARRNDGIIGEIQRGKIFRIAIVNELVKSPEFVILIPIYREKNLSRCIGIKHCIVYITIV